MAELCIPCEQFVNSGENERKNTEISGQAGKISPRGAKKDARRSGRLCYSADLVQLQSHGALAASGRVLVQNAAGDSLIDFLHRNLVRAIGLGAIAFCGNSLELLDGGLQRGLLGLVAGVSRLGDQNTLLGRLDIRQTKHLLWQVENMRDLKNPTVQNDILTVLH